MDNRFMVTNKGANYARRRAAAWSPARRSPAIAGRGRGGARLSAAPTIRERGSSASSREGRGRRGATPGAGGAASIRCRAWRTAASSASRLVVEGAATAASASESGSKGPPTASRAS